MLGRLVTHVAPALEEAGDLAEVRERLTAVLRRGTGARAQRGAAGPAGGGGAGRAPDPRLTLIGCASAPLCADRSRILRTASQISPTTTSPSTT